MNKTENRKQKTGNRKWNLKSFILGSFLFLAFSSLTYAAIVPCGGSGQADCRLSDIKTLFTNTTTEAFKIVALFALAVVIYTGFKLMTGRDKSVEITESKERAWKVVTGILIFFGAPALIIMILRSIGLNDEFMKMFNFFFATLIDTFSISVYAVSDPALLPNPVAFDNPLDLLAQILHLTIRWFVFPLILLSWLYSGFLYVKAQGNPEEITYAHNWLLYTFIGTVIIMLAETLFAVLSSTIASIIT